MIVLTMQLKPEHIEAFQKAYKLDVGEDLTYQEAFEMLRRLVGVFSILDKAAQREAEAHSEPQD